MKTATTDLLKKQLLIIEISKQTILTKTSTGYMLRDNSNNEDFFIDGYTLLGKPNELKEEDAEKLFYNPIDSTNLTHYANLRNLFSLLESEIYWENPWGVNGAHLDSYKDLWHEAQQKTFDKNRTLIFVKN